MDKKHTRIFVTGGTGFTGSYLLRYLVQEGYQDVRALRRPDSSMALLGDAAGRVEWAPGDILDYPALEEAMAQADVVIHCAGLVSLDARDRKMLKKVNAEGTANVVNAALALDVKRLIHLSSIAALGHRDDHAPMDESFKWERSALKSAYAISKFQAEMEVWRGMEEGLSAVIVNPSFILGSGDWKGNSSSRVFHLMGKGFPFYPKGECGFVDVRDVARFLLLLLERDISGQRYILSAENWSHRDLLTAIARSAGVKPPFLPLLNWMGALAWRWEWLRSQLQGGKALLTRDAFLSASQSLRYNAEKSSSLGFSYLPLSQTIEETTRQWLESRGEAVAVLPL